MLVLLVAVAVSGVLATGASFAEGDLSAAVGPPPVVEGSAPPVIRGGPTASASGFVENVGQSSPTSIRYSANVRLIQVGFADSEILMNLFKRPLASSAIPDAVPRHPIEVLTQGVTLRITFEGSDAVAPVGRGVSPHLANYLLGNDSTGWRAGVRSYEEVVYSDLYPGVDLVWKTTGSSLKYEFVLAAGADLDAIRIAYEGIEDLSLDGTSVIMHTPFGDVRDAMSHVYQASGAAVACRPVLHGPASMGFSCDGWDRRSTLVIDPLIYGTYLGGSGWEYGHAIAADQAGNAYVVGETLSTDFPSTPGAFDRTGSGIDAFVAKFNATGTLVYATYLGGDGFDWAYSVSVDTTGSATVSGTTQSPNFPTTPGAFDTTIGGTEDGFVVRLNETGGGLMFGTYFGGASLDSVSAHAVGPGGEVYVTGYTWSNETSFPVSPWAFDPTFNSLSGPDAYVARLDTLGSTLGFATYLGGDSSEYPAAIAVDVGGNAYVTGQVRSNETTFPVTPGAFDTSYNGEWDVFVAKLNATDLIYATYVGGDDRWGDDTGVAIAVDDAGRAFVAGRTGSNQTTFPVTPGAYDTTHDDRWRDAFVASLSPDGSALQYCTYLGGSQLDEAMDLVLDPMGGVYVVGSTGSPDFPWTAGGFDTTFEAGDAFLVGLNDNGSALTYSTFVGGGGWDEGDGLALDRSGNLYVGGRTASTDFPVTPGAFDVTSDGVWDAFVVKFGAVVPVPPTLHVAPTSLDFGVVAPGYAGDLAFQVRNAGGGTLNYQLSESAPWLSVAPLGGTSLWEWDTVTVSVDAASASAGLNSAIIDVDSDGGALSVLVTMTVDRPPVARATVQPGQGNLSTAFVFDGTSSTDPDGDALNYGWDLGDGTLANGPVVAHTYATRGGFDATLRVSDGFGLTDSVTIPVGVANRPPVADAGPNQTSVRNAAIVLDGTASSDPDGDSISYRWTQVAGPQVSLSNPDGSVATFLPAVLSTYVFELIIADAQATATASVQVEVVNRSPTAFAGPDMGDVLRHREVRLGASGWDPDGDLLTYAWSQTSGPLVSLSGTSGASVSLTPDMEGIYRFVMTVSDGLGGTATDSVQVVVINLPPWVDAGPNRTFEFADELSITGSATDSDGDSLTFEWTQEGGPSALLSGRMTPTLAFSPSGVGDYVFRVKVTDGHGGSATDVVTVTVERAPPEIPNVPVQDWFLLVVVVVAVTAVAVLVLLYRRRRRGEEQDPPTEVDEGPPPR